MPPDFDVEMDQLPADPGDPLLALDGLRGDSM